MMCKDFAWLFSFLNRGLNWERWLYYWRDPFIVAFCSALYNLHFYHLFCVVWKIIVGIWCPMICPLTIEIGWFMVDQEPAKQVMGKFIQRLWLEYENLLIPCYLYHTLHYTSQFLSMKADIIIIIIIIIIVIIVVVVVIIIILSTL